MMTMVIEQKTYQPRPLAGITDRDLARLAIQTQESLNFYLKEMSFRAMNLTSQYECRGFKAYVTWDKPVYTPVEVARGVYDVVLTNYELSNE
jgi:hypothetical protein